MIEKFKEQVDGQHAPEDLINSTIEKLHKPRRSKAPAIGMLSVCAIVVTAFIMVFVIGHPKNIMNYNSISDASMKDMPQSGQITSEYQSVGEFTVLIRTSETQEVAPESLISGKKTDIKGYEVYLGINEISNSYLAAFTKDDMNYCIFARDGDKEEFEAYLMDLLN